MTKTLILSRKEKTMTEKKYNKKEPVPTVASDAMVPYGDINALKVQLVNKVMRMDNPDDVKSVLEFAKKQEEQQRDFIKDWDRGVTVDEFRIRCKDKLKKIYAED